ncbi:hypothetical protein CsSME_00028160 [Camellia sinensis var. sinensis]
MKDGIMDDGGLEGYIEEMRKLAKDKSPYLGMEFPSKEATYEFYNEFGRIVGFRIRRDYCNKSKKDGVMTSRKFVCCKEGEREKDKQYTVIKKILEVIQEQIVMHSCIYLLRRTCRNGLCQSLITTTTTICIFLNVLI